MSLNRAPLPDPVDDLHKEGANGIRFSCKFSKTIHFLKDILTVIFSQTQTTKDSIVIIAY